MMQESEHLEPEGEPAGNGSEPGRTARPGAGGGTANGNDLGEGHGNGEGEGQKPLPLDLRALEGRLDLLLRHTQDPARLQAGMGIRLAVGMALEIQEKRDLGEKTGPLVAEWTSRFGSELVEPAIQIAREFLLQPQEMRKAVEAQLASLGLSKP